MPKTPPEELAHLSLGQRDRLLFGLRERQFGRRLTGMAVCPGCDEQLTMEFTTSDLTLPETATGELSVEHAGWRVEFRLPDSVDLAAAAALENARHSLLGRCIRAVRRDGAEANVDTLPEAVCAAVEARMAEADPQAQIQISLACPTCAARWEAEFDIASYLWTEVQTLAGKLLREVHQIARAYGWTERDILALTPARRAAYLALTGA